MINNNNSIKVLLNIITGEQIIDIFQNKIIKYINKNMKNINNKYNKTLNNYKK